MKQSRSFRRPILGALAALTLALPIASSSGCAGDWLPSDYVNGLRLFGVTADRPYALPGETVTFTMSYKDGYPTGERPVQILWIGGCYNPPGDLYFGCFAQIGQAFQKLAEAGPPEPGKPPMLPPGLIQLKPDNIFSDANVFSTTLPEDIVSARPDPQGGPKYGLMYVFFAACAGQIKFVELDPGGKAGFLPFACFDPDTGARLPADSFVPGYSVVYSFEDGRENPNPEVANLLFDGEPMSENLDEIPVVKACPSTLEERRETGCFAGEPYAGCEQHEIDVDVQPDIADLDPGEELDGKPLHEAVWVDYLYDGGNFTGGGIRLISGVTEGYKPDHKTYWVAPNEPGLYTIWASVRDTRGGSKILERNVRVE